jgi:hypothetical protein
MAECLRRCRHNSLTPDFVVLSALSVATHVDAAAPASVDGRGASYDSTRDDCRSVDGAFHENDEVADASITTVYPSGRCAA